MNQALKLILLLCVVVFSNPSFGQEIYAEVKVETPSEETRLKVINLLELDHYQSNNNSITAIISGSELKRLKDNKISFQILVNDFVKHTIELNRNLPPANDMQGLVAFQGSGCDKISDLITTPTRFGKGGTLRLGADATYSGYFKYEEMLTQMQDLVAAYPTLIQLYSIGNSALGTPIYGVKISDNVSVDEDEPEVLYTALQHAREAIGGTSMIFYMQYLLENYSTDSKIKALVDNREIFIIPCLNPDGYMYNYSGVSTSYPVTGGGLWRKTRRYIGPGTNDIGVDINRNYGVDWGNCGPVGSSCGTNTKSAETYYGPSAFSEPETQALRSFVYQRRFVNAIDQHCFGPYYSLPFGRPTLHVNGLSKTDSAYYTRIPALMGTYNGHRAGNSPQTVAYEVAGGIKDWLLVGDIGAGTIPKTKIYGMTGEAGGGAFWAPVNQIIQLCKENLYQNLQMAYAAGEYFDLQDLSDIAVTSKTGNFNFKLQRIGLKSSPVTVSIVPIENVQSVGSAVTTTITNYYDTYTGNISYALDNNFAGGQKLKFAWKIESGGITTYDTVTKFYSPNVLFSDDMEGTNITTNWTTTSNTGVNWAYSNLQSFAGTKSMTESPGANVNYTVSATRTVTYKNALNLLDASEAYLSFWTKYRAENFRDKLQVQVSKNNTDWEPVCGSYMVSEENTTTSGNLEGKPALTGIRDTWTRILVNLSAYKGNSTVYFRYQFTSDDDVGSNFAQKVDDGFYIDNVKVIKTTTLSTLNVKFVNVMAKWLPNRTSQIDWEAYVDDEHAYFELQRSSSNSGNFSSVAKVTGLPPYYAIDPQPLAGDNYYRVKQVDKNGKITYSKVVKLQQNNLPIIASIYPNPVLDELNVKFENVRKSEQYLFQITNTVGQVLIQETNRIKLGESVQKLQLKKLPAQVYYLKILNSNNEVVSIQKIIKQ